jgi:hypothetical protein
MLRFAFLNPAAFTASQRWAKVCDMELQRVKPSASSRGISTAIRRLLWGGLIVCASILVVLIGAGVFLAYQITTARDAVENVTPASYLLSNYENVSFTDSDGAVHQGWLLIGLRGAPAVILCHGYDSNRSSMLSLGTELQANHFNVYLFNFEASGSRRGFSNLGVHEAAVLQSAIARVRTLPGVNPNRIGLYGYSLGAYAALVASEHDAEIDALAVDSVYSEPSQMFDVQMDRLLGGAGALFRLISGTEFRIFSWGTNSPDVRSGLSKLAGKPKLFVASDDAPALEVSTRRLYEDAPQPKRLVVLPHAQSSAESGPERKEYEEQILNFFLYNLPLRSD